MSPRIWLSLLLLAGCSSPVPSHCAADTSCPTGQVCVAGACVTACAADKDCRNGRVCRAGRCADPVVDGGSDGATPDLASASDLASPDLTAVPSSAACFMGWQGLAGACPAPQISSAYYANSGCANTAGMFFVGSYFEYNGPDSNGGDDGPTTEGTINYVNVSRWNMLTDTMMCVTICPSCGQAGDVYLRNPDGKTSNTVTIAFH
jgi:Cys-rich repeat protein